MGRRPKIGELSAWGGGPDRDRYRPASPRPFANLPQVRVDTLLWQHADSRSPGRIRARQEVVDLALDDEGVTVTAIDRDSGETYTVRARYVVAADGGRVCASRLEVPIEGARAIREITSLYLEADRQRMRTTGVPHVHLVAVGPVRNPSAGPRSLGKRVVGVAGRCQGTQPEDAS